MACLVSTRHVRFSLSALQHTNFIIKQYPKLYTTKPRAPTLQGDICEIFDKAVESVLPSSMVKRALQLDGNKMTVGDREYPLNKNVHILAFGKAVAGMVRAAEDIVGDHVVDGVASVPKGIRSTLEKAGKLHLLPSSDSKVKMLEGAKGNYPDEHSLRAALEIYDLAKSLTKDDIALTLISGGGSALLPAPVAPVSLQDLTQTTQIMSKHGATIQQMNTIRKHIEMLKGGGLAKAAAPAKLISLILSDVVGDPLDFIASGPTVPDYTSPQQCMDLFRILNIERKIPKTVFDLVEREAQEQDHYQTSSDNGPTLVRVAPLFKNVQNMIVGSNKIATQTAVDRATELGYVTCVLSTEIEGEARDQGIRFAKLANFICRSMGNKTRRDVQQLMQNELELVQLGVPKDTINRIRTNAENANNSGRPLCVIGAGETVVSVKGKGMGGRNQEICLSAAMKLHEYLYEDLELRTHFDVMFLSGATDGQDGPNDAAGACVAPSMFSRASKQGLDPIKYLENNDSYHFFEKFNSGKSHLRIGLTGTNVMDLHILLIRPDTW